MHNPTFRWLPLLSVALCAGLAPAAWSAERHHGHEKKSEAAKSAQHHHGHDHHHDHDHESVQHGAHVHGQANAFVVLEGRNLSVVLESPAANIVGFEHRANTPEQRSIVLAAQETLAQGERVLKVRGGDCQLNLAESDVSQLLREDAEPNTLKDHDHHGHHSANKHDDKEHQNTRKKSHQHSEQKHDTHPAAESDKKHSHHGHGHEHKHKHGEYSHADISVNYEFDCAQPERIERLEFTAFEAFPGLEKITAQWINDAGQGASDLHARNPILRMQ